MYQKKYVFNKDWIVCLKDDNYSRIKNKHKLGNLYYNITIRWNKNSKTACDLILVISLKVVLVWDSFYFNI